MEEINTNYFKPKRLEKTYTNKEKSDLISLAIKFKNLSKAAKQLYISRNTAKEWMKKYRQNSNVFKVERA